MGGKNNRVKGHKLERDVNNVFRDILSYSKSQTSRAVSKLLDDCGIDIALNGPDYMNLDFILQCKQGYKKARPKFELIYQKIKNSITEHLPNTKTSNAPIILIHRLDGYKKEHFQWIWCFEDAINFLLAYKELKDLIVRLKDLDIKEVNILIDEWNKNREE